MFQMKAAMVAGVVIVAGAIASARQAQPDVLPALLEEVRGLRAAMEQMASAGPRIQLFTSRLQIEEARINNMIHRHDSVLDSLANAQKDLANREEQQRRLVASATTGTPQGRDAADMLPLMNHEVEMAKSTVNRYAAEEAQLAADISAEQARWNDISNRLDELERLLAKR